MLSTLVVASTTWRAGARPGDAVLRTLAALVPAAVDGVVRDVALLGIGADDAILGIAEEAGCSTVTDADFAGALAKGAAAARGPWLLVLRAGAMPTRGFGEEVAAEIDAAGRARRSLILREACGALRGLWGVLLPVAGVILRRDALIGASCRTFADVARLARPSRDLRTRVAVLT